MTPDSIPICRWKSTPGSFDVLNMFYRPPLTPAGFPRLQRQAVETPKQLLQYKDWKQYQPGDAIHFFIDDYRFEHLWTAPRKYASRLEGKVTLTPDFSLFTDYPDPVLHWQVYRSRWLGAYWQTIGATVIPTVSWAGPESFGYCFEGVEQGSTVALSTNGCAGSSREFSAGVDTLIEQVDPELILCYGSFRHVYIGRSEIPQVVNYPHHFGTFRGGAALHAPLTSYIY